MLQDHVATRERRQLHRFGRYYSLGESPEKNFLPLKNPPLKTKDRVSSDPTIKLNLRPQIQLYWTKEAGSGLTPAGRAITMEALAAKLDLPRQALRETRVYKEGAATEWTLSEAAVQRLYDHLTLAGSEPLLPGIETMLLEPEPGQMEAWFVPNQSYHCLSQADGSRIINLLDQGLDTEPVIANLQDSFEQAERLMVCRPRGGAIVCEQALLELDEQEYLVSLSNLSDPGGLMAFEHSRGRLHLLLAAILLNEGEHLELAAEHFLRARDEYVASGCFHLLALAYLGQAIALRRLNQLDDAAEALIDAGDYARHEAMSARVDVTALKQAVELEEDILGELWQFDPGTSLNPRIQAGFKLFSVATGATIAARQGMVGLELLTRKDYESGDPMPLTTDQFNLDLNRLAAKADIDLGAVSYIVQLPPGVETDHSLQTGDWLFIAAEDKPAKLRQKQIAVLIIGETLRASLKTLTTEAADHYFLRAEHPEDASLIVYRYGAPVEAIEAYYRKCQWGGKIEHEPAFEVAMTGAVIGVVRPGSVLMPEQTAAGPARRASAVIRRIPVVSQISAGLGVIAPQDINEHLYWDEVECAGANFGLLVEGDSMVDDDILPGDIALIRQQEHVENGDIAAIVIQTPEESIEVIKAYHFYDRPGHEHWFLKSSNQAGAHLVVVPDEARLERIRRFYAGRMENVAFYPNAELRVAGKFIKKVSVAQL
ncbi:MAG: hypothetical protein H6631_10320 [Anaerolineaceae bacterium]|nr:hypothetical protein [Anaerolineaceae bacterium]